MPVERNWTVPEDNIPLVSVDDDGNLVIHPPRVVGSHDEDSLYVAIVEAISHLRDIGGTIQIASQRAEVAPNVVATESYIFAFSSFTPLVRRLPREDAPAPDLSPDEVAQHFPEGPLEDLAAEAEAEEPALEPDADSEPAHAVVE